MHAQTSNELDETVKVAELLYTVNRKLGTVTDHLLVQLGMALGDREPHSVEALINSVVKEAENKQSKLDDDDQTIAASEVFQSSNLDCAAELD